MKTCPHCGCTDIDEDAARGDATCTGCGTVLEESIVVSENQFQERAGGSGHTLVGQFVSADRAASQNVHGMGSQESREVTYQKGKKVIEEIASQLRINQHCSDTAFNFYKMCVSRNLTRGRIRVNVVACCMYMTCRLENTAHLLLDFSDVTQINVFDLGRTLSFITRSLRINLPSTDPCLYIMRFACMLEFGEKQKDVVNLATRLVQRMKRDWMSTGRRPTGLCGAALLIAARSLNFNRTIADVVRVVHISEGVVRKRLDEFSQTPSGSLTIDEFSSVDLEHSEDPPAFREARRKAREDQLRKEADEAERIANELQPMEEEVEKALEKKRREKFRTTAFAKIVGGTLEGEGLGKAEDALVRNEILDSVYDAAVDAPSCSQTEHYKNFGPSLEVLGIRSGAVQSSTSSDEHSVVMAKPLDDDLDDISDSEIDTYILTEQEAQIKEKYWMKTNGEVMKMIEQRKKEREEQEAADKNDPTKKKKKPRVKRDGRSATSAADAMEKVIHEKKLSNKVNYDILKEIEGTGLVAAKKEKQESSAAMIVKEVNELIKSANLEDETAVLESPSMEFARGRMSHAFTRRERTLANKNAKSTDTNHLDALRSAIGVKSEASGSNSQKFAVPTTSAKGGRYGKMKPNVSGAGARAPSIKKEMVSPKKEVRGSSVVTEKQPYLGFVFKAPQDEEETPDQSDAVNGTESGETDSTTEEDTEQAVEAKKAPAIKSRYAKAKPNAVKPKVIEKKSEVVDDNVASDAKGAKEVEPEDQKTAVKSRYNKPKPSVNISKTVGKKPEIVEEPQQDAEVSEEPQASNSDAAEGNGTVKKVAPKSRYSKGRPNVSKRATESASNDSAELAAPKSEPTAKKMKNN